MRRDAFTLVELLLAVAIGSMVAFVLAAILHGLVQGDGAQTRHLAGPVAARSALLRMAREVSCAFAPPGTATNGPGSAPLVLSRPAAADPGEPELRLAFYLPVPSRAPQLPGFYGVERVTYEVRPVPGSGADRELRRLAVPCAGPRTNDVRENILLQGPFQLVVRVPDPDSTGVPAGEIWPPEDAGRKEEGGRPPLPASLWFSLRLPGEESVEVETPVHCALTLPAVEE